jgi:hypothetical protein
MPNIPTLPFDQACFDSQSITTSPSDCSISEYSYGISRPSLLPVPRMSTAATT